MQGLIVSIYSNGVNCSNGGISSRVNKAIIIGDDIPQLFEARDDMPAIKIIRRNIGGREYIHAEPVNPCPSNEIGYMAGGCFVYSSDSRFRQLICDYPIALHDRSETQTQYNHLSR